MAKNKTQATQVPISSFLNSFVEQDWKREESMELIRLMRSWSGFEPTMWGPSIIGFGQYHYVYESGHQGDAPMLGFSPRKAQFSLYVYSKTPKSDALLTQLGKFKMGKSCIYIKRLSDINLDILEALCLDTISYLNEHHQCGACK